MSSTLLENLDACNQTERDAIVKTVLGSPTISLRIRTLLNKGLNAQVPVDAYWAIDFNIDWINLALNLTYRPSASGIYENLQGLHHANNEDIDLFVAYADHAVFHLIMLEGKGQTRWRPDQLRHKVQRLRSIFGEDGDTWPSVIPHFGIISPLCPTTLSDIPWARWMGRVPWIKLQTPPRLVRAFRCDELGRKSQLGNHLRLRTLTP